MSKFDKLYTESINDIDGGSYDVDTTDRDYDDIIDALKSREELLANLKSKKRRL